MTDEANSVNEPGAPEETQLERPDRSRIFYANAVDWIVSEGQEVVIDFKLVMKEDFAATAKYQLKETGRFEGTANVDLDKVPVEVRVYLPFNRFVGFMKKMAEMWEEYKAAGGTEPAQEEGEADGDEKPDA